MTTDRDIAALLPDAPPPAPARRAATIDAALRRFDKPGEPGVPLNGTTRGATAQPWMRRPQVGLVVGAALIAVVGLPTMWLSVPRESGAPDPTSRSVPQSAAAPAPTERPADTRGSEAPTPLTVPADSTPGLVPPKTNAAPPEFAAQDSASPPPLPPSPPPAVMTAPPPAMAASAAPPGQNVRAADTAVRNRTERRTEAAPEPSSAALARNDEDASAIVVTGARRSRVRILPRGDWNACTVNDPARSLRGCGRAVDRRRRGAAGQSAAQIAQGLTQAWQGDREAAIAAFDRAIELEPRSVSGHLNRGLAYAGEGDLDRAIADLDLAIRYAPGDARGYFNRSLLLRQRGDTRRAQADERTAAGLDARYDDVLR